MVIRSTIGCPVMPADLPLRGRNHLFLPGRIGHEYLAQPNSTNDKIMASLGAILGAENGLYRANHRPTLLAMIAQLFRGHSLHTANSQAEAREGSSNGRGIGAFFLIRAEKINPAFFTTRPDFPVIPYHPCGHSPTGVTGGLDMLGNLQQFTICSTRGATSLWGYCAILSGLCSLRRCQ